MILIIICLIFHHNDLNTVIILSAHSFRKVHVTGHLSTNLPQYHVNQLISRCHTNLLLSWSKLLHFRICCGLGEGNGFSFHGWPWRSIFQLACNSSIASPLVKLAPSLPHKETKNKNKLTFIHFSLCPQRLHPKDSVERNTLEFPNFKIF